MATTIYLIRHGESEANLRIAFLGQVDLNLTELGLKQAQKTAAYLKKDVERPEAIYSSDLMRAYNTARCTAEALNMPIIKDKELREIDAGLWENVTFTELDEKFPESFHVWKHNLGFARCDGGESVMQVQERFVSAVTRIAQKHDGGAVYIFTHSTPVRVFAAHCLNLPQEEIRNFASPSNASVTKATYENGAFKLIEYSHDDFMGELKTILPPNC